jgi:hypothetical protein
LSNAPTASETPIHSQDSNTEPPTAPNDNVTPPSPAQIKRELDKPLPVTASAGPGDSPPLPPGHLDLLNDGIADQQSRREYRLPILGAALGVLAVFTVCLAGIVFTLGNGFFQALQPENIAKFAAVELKGKIDKVSAAVGEKETSSSNEDVSKKTSDKESKSSTFKTAEERSNAKEHEPVKVEAKIYGEIRDSMVPLVALVSILAVAIVVILATMLKAAFAPHPNNTTGQKEKEESSPVPILEAIKGLVDSIKAAWK